jgi:hypothetical protein
VKEITLKINVSEEKAAQVLAELAKLTYAISSACGPITQEVKEV